MTAAELPAAESPAADSSAPAQPDPPPAVPEPMLYSVGRIFCRIFCTLYFDLKVHGLENVPAHGGVLLLSNHQSNLDPVLVGVRLQRPLSFLAKSELFKNRFFAWLITNLNAYPVRQGAGDVGAVRETIRRLEEGHALVLFPEGTRTEDGHLQPLQSGFALIARKVHVPIVPVIIEGSFDAWPKGTKLFRPRRITVRFASPIDVQGLRPAEIVHRVSQRMADLFTTVHTEHTRPLGRAVVIQSLRRVVPPAASAML